ncbi:phosphoribosylanthranilate isomerase [Micromonospora sp. FIMYZ51]|uniref:phosphoribosylanthranilate isomerase n=1 Tax=Micromonospora sp. FIMYZ51 TaxID=3051832 RepID=UPI00311FE801
MFIKVCGLRTSTDVAAAVRAGVDAVGFMLTESVRRVTPTEAGRLAAEVPPQVLTVGVFRGEPVDVIRDCVTTAGLRAVQLHGGEPPGHYEALRDLDVTLIRATSVASGADLRPGAYGEELLIIDSPQPGSGQGWNWSALQAKPVTGRWLLAGGLHPGNVAAAITALAPWGVDVSSGVEARRGIKEPQLIAEFVAAARSNGPGSTRFE